MDALKAMGFGVTKTSQYGKPRGMTEGIPDLYAAHPRWGMRIWIEVKAGKNKPSPKQLEWHAAERAAGGVVIVAHGVDELVVELKKLGAPLT